MRTKSHSSESPHDSGQAESPTIPPSCPRIERLEALPEPFEASSQSGTIESMSGNPSGRNASKSQPGVSLDASPKSGKNESKSSTSPSPKSGRSESTSGKSSSSGKSPSHA